MNKPGDTPIVWTGEGGRGAERRQQMMALAEFTACSDAWRRKATWHVGNRQIVREAEACSGERSEAEELRKGRLVYITLRALNLHQRISKALLWTLLEPLYNVDCVEEGPHPTHGAFHIPQGTEESCLYLFTPHQLSVSEGQRTVFENVYISSLWG